MEACTNLLRSYKTGLIAAMPVNKKCFLTDRHVKLHNQTSDYTDPLPSEEK